MTKEMILELFGYLGSILVLVSMLMTSVVRLRVINLIGSAVFTVYAILIRSYPTAFLNGCLVIVNIWQLLKLQKKTDGSYELQRIGTGEGFSKWMLKRYADDIQRYFPALSEEDMPAFEGFAVFYEDQAAGLMLGKKEGAVFHILLDYTTPAYRDCSVGAYLYAELPKYGVKELVCGAVSPEHVRYLEKMGFVMQEDGEYLKELSKEM